MKKEGSDLSDIILEKSSKKVQNRKKWILTIASAIVLFLIVLLIMKLLKSGDLMKSGDSIANVGESVNNIKKEKPVEVVKEKPEQKEEESFKKEPIIEESADTDAKFEEMVRKLREQDKLKKEKKVEPTKNETKHITQTPVQSEIKPAKEIPVITTPTEVKEPPRVITQPRIIPPNESPKPKVIHHVKPKVVHHTNPKRSVAQTFSKVTNSSKTPSGYYIQVGATSKSFPDRRYLQKIKNAGFDYVVHTVNSNGRRIKKILVGPYSSRGEATRALPKARSAIRHDAYILRIN